MMPTRHRPGSLRSPLPGHASPAAGFEAPFDLLSACHERVHRSLRLLARLRDHVAASGCDMAAQEAARDVIRYFDVAAPRHHEDEERHVFPPLLACGNHPLRALVLRLQQDHRDMEVAWGQARAVLQRLSDVHVPHPGFAWQASELAALDVFSSLYDRHIADEETLVYPASQGQISAEQLRHMSTDMMNRRGVRSTAALNLES